jgi:hypothetical protein
MTRSIFHVLPFAVFCLCVFVARAPGADEAPPGESEEMTIILRQTPMPPMDSSRLGEILNRYYKEGLGGPENWERVVSLRVAGRISMEGGDLEFNAYQKKPHYIKMTLHGPQRNLVLGYDGTVAWQIVPGTRGKAQAMGKVEARRFIHDAHFGNHLLYPYALGKQIAYVDTVPVEGTICHQLRVTLDTGFQVDYFIDIRSYLEIKVVSTDLRSGVVSSVTYQDYIREYGMPIAKKVVSEEAGKWVSTLVLDEVKVNTGIMPWMFKMPK